jgi:hypothetical protein
MAFTIFKSIATVLEYYPITYQESIIIHPKNAEYSPYFADRLNLAITEGIVFNSEYAICENIISPILTEIWQIYRNQCLLWSHQPLTFDETLNGVPDYIVAKRSTRGKILLEKPFLMVVEAKKDNFEEGWGQCLAELIAVQKINQSSEDKLFGIVTNGKLWEFAQLHNNIFTKNSTAYLLDNLPTLMAAVNFAFYEAIQQLQLI